MTMYGVLVRERGHIDDANDVIALNPRSGPRFCERSGRRRHWVPLVLELEDLDRESMPHRGVARRNDDPHPPRSNLLLDAVFPCKQAPGSIGGSVFGVSVITASAPPTLRANFLTAPALPRGRGRHCRR